VRFVTFRKDGGEPTPGIVEGDAIRTIGTATLRQYPERAPQERIAWHTGDDLDRVASVQL